MLQQQQQKPIIKCREAATVISGDPLFPKKKSREKRYFSFSLSLSLPFQPFDTSVTVTISAKSPVPYQVSALLAPVSLKGQLWG